MKKGNVVLVPISIKNNEIETLFHQLKNREKIA